MFYFPWNSGFFLEPLRCKLNSFTWKTQDAVKKDLCKSDMATREIPARGQCWATLTPRDAGAAQSQWSLCSHGERRDIAQGMGASLLWLLAKSDCNPITCSPARLLLPWCGVRFKPGRSNLLTWSCETAAICRSHGSGFACKCHSFDMQVMGLVQTMLSRKSWAVRTKGWFCSAEIFESWELSLSLCPPCSALPGGWEAELGWRGGDSGPLPMLVYRLHWKAFSSPLSP